MSIGGSFILDGNSKRYEVAEHIATKTEINPWMLFTLKNEKSIRTMKTEADVKTSVVGTQGFLVVLFKIQIE